MGITTRTSLLSALRTARCPFRLPFGSSSLAFWSSPSHPRSSPRSCTIRSISSLNQKPLPEHEDFFRYTGGRWLWDEQQHLRDQYHIFNVAELQRVAAKSVGSKSCASMTKLAERRYNKDFRLVMNDGKVVIARLPNPNAGPSFYATASEVAHDGICKGPERVLTKRREDGSNDLTNAMIRLGQYSRFQFPKSMNGVLLLIALLALNIS